LVVEPAEKDVMRRPPNPASADIFDRWMVVNILWVGIVMAILSLLAGDLFLRRGQAYWQTMVFTTLTLSQMAFALAARSDHSSVFQIGLLKNRSLVGAILLTFVLQLALIYLPFLNQIFSTAPLKLADVLLAIGLSILPLLITEVVKWIERVVKRNKQR